jgi:phosphoadenosine phosphosulfate reductase
VESKPMAIYRYHKGRKRTEVLHPMNTLFGKLDEIAIDRVREFAAISERMHPDGYYVAFSGGKDSTVILDIVKRANVKFTAHYHLTTCDPPELVHFIKRKHPDVLIEKPPMTMWELIRKRKMPPRRNARFCCEVLKERGGEGRIIITGVRWGESTRPAKRKMLEACYKDKSKRYLHCLIDWSEDDVWHYIRSRNLPYCNLYDEGFGRIGCVLCPMTRQVDGQVARWPKIARAWEKAVKATFNPQGKNNYFDSPEHYWRWWLDRDASINRDTDQILMFEDQ